MVGGWLSARIADIPFATASVAALRTVRKRLRKAYDTVFLVLGVVPRF